METTKAEYRNTNKDYNTVAHLTYSCQYHVIFCPKYRRKVLIDPIDIRLKEICAQIADQYEFIIPDIEVMPDHVHMIIDCNPRLGICKCVSLIKGNSSRILRAEFPELRSKLPTLWTRSSFISSVGSVSLDVVKKYIEEQKNK